MYLRVVDRYHDQSISAFVTPSSKFPDLKLLYCAALPYADRTFLSIDYRFLLLHDTGEEDGIKQFFTDLHDLFIKATLNPLYVESEPIRSTSFHDKVMLLARKYL